MYEKITPENVLMFAIRNYSNPHCEGEKEFEDDLKRFKYIKRLLRKYYDTGILKERLTPPIKKDKKGNPNKIDNEIYNIGSCFPNSSRCFLAYFEAK